jgi:iron complex transport system substrate-binding protein
MKTEMEDLIDSRRGGKPLRVYHEIDENYYSASSNSFIGSIYGLLNLINIADKADKEGYGYPKLSPEYILSANPEIIILPGKDLEYINKIKIRPGWSAIDAVVEENFLLLDPDIGSRWGPRIIDFAKSVVKQTEEN